LAKLITIVQRRKTGFLIVTLSAGDEHSVWSAEVQREKFSKVSPSKSKSCERFSLTPLTVS
jgi:hypothetical protein